jgi:hypothetical protein
VEGSGVLVVAVLGKTSAAHAAARPLIAIASVKTSNQQATPSCSGTQAAIRLRGNVGSLGRKLLAL